MKKYIPFNIHGYHIIIIYTFRTSECSPTQSEQGNASAESLRQALRSLGLLKVIKWLRGAKKMS